MKHLYAPEHTIKQYVTVASEHVDHMLYVKFANGRGAGKWQLFGLQAVGMATNQVHLTNEHTAGWFPVSELWAYSSPQCMTCEG